MAGFPVVVLEVSLVVNDLEAIWIVEQVVDAILGVEEMDGRWIVPIDMIA